MSTESNSTNSDSIALSPAVVPLKSWVAVLAAALGAFMAVLDIQITNSSLPNIQGALGAGLDEGTWISTSYLVAEIVTIPLTAWLSRVFSVRLYVIGNACLFIFFSICCAWAWDLNSMIVFRALQGFTGGTLIPMAFNIILTSLPKSKQPLGLAAFSLTATFAPSIGPAIGGWLTDSFGWQYIFYLNLIPGIVMLGLLLWSLPGEPLNLKLLKQGDWFGVATMAIGLASLEVVLEEGNRLDWLGSELIMRLSVVAALFLILFLWRQFTAKQPLINLRLLSHRNFGLGSVANVALGFGLYGSIYLLPVYLAQVQGYSASDIGQVLMWMGLPQLLIIPFVPWLMQKIDSRILLGGGIVLFAASALMNAFMSSDYAGPQLIISMLVRAMGQPLIMVPLSTMATSGIARDEAGSASALFNMMRNLGGSIGIALISTFLSQREQFHWQRIGEAISSGGAQTQQRISDLSQYLLTRGADAATAHSQALKVISNLVQQQTNVMSFNDAFWILGLIVLLSGLTVFLLKKVVSTEAAAAH